MSRAAEFLAQFQATLDAVPLPERISAQYRLDSCLSRSAGTGGGSVWLLRRRDGGAPFVLKTGTDAGLWEEFQLMERLPEDLPVPRGVDCFQEEGVWYLVRTYLPGKPLAELEVPYRRWPEAGEALCALLDRLHSLDPPIIHRDIKPENVILSPEGRPGLIDFGIARSYKPDRECDTVMMGTRATAAPEQYGYAQSDRRTDVYALGVTLRWLASGTYGPDGLDRAPCSRRLKRCLRKAASFSPEDRYPSAGAFGAALERARRPLWRALLPAAVLAAAVLSLGAWLGLREPPVRFESPLLEAAVRYELDKPQGPVSRADLERVERLALVGNQVLEEGSSYEYRICSYVDGDVWTGEPGDVADLSLLAEMPNLQVLYLCHQPVTDLSPLEGLPLRELYLSGCAVPDLTPLRKLPSLETLFLGECPASDFSPLASLYGLRVLNMDHTSPESLDFLRDIYVTELSLGLSRPQDGDWSPLAQAPSLWRLLLWDPPEEAVAALPEVEFLSRLSLCDYAGADLRELDLPRLDTLGIFGGEPALEGLEQMEGLRHLDLCNLGDVDLTAAQALPRLVWVSSYNCRISDYGPLAAIPTLEEVRLDGPGLERFRETCLAYDFAVSQSP